MTKLEAHGEITFDTDVSEEGQGHIEGCYRVSGQDWQVFYFTHHHNGKLWFDEPIIRKDAIWKSGISGLDIVYSADKILNKNTVIEILSDILRISEWSEVHGPDSLQLK